MERLRIIFCGTPDFSVPTVELLHAHNLVDLIGIVTMPDRPSGRGQKLSSPPVAVFAKEHKIPLLQTDNINKEGEYLSNVLSKGVDLIVVLAFAQFLGKEILEIPKLGCFNIHTSLLPKYRGAAPIQHAILNGDSETGITIQKMVKKMDAGDIAHSCKISIGDYESGGQLYTKLKFTAAVETDDFINKILTNNINYIQQDESRVTFAPSIDKKSGELKFLQFSAHELFNKIRAFNPRPNTFCNILYKGKKKRLKIIMSKVDQAMVKSGEVETKYGSLLVGCKEGTLRLSEIQLEGKKACKDYEFLNGVQNPQTEIKILMED